jgi:hypothetical protein
MVSHLLLICPFFVCSKILSPAHATPLSQLTAYQQTAFRMQIALQQTQLLDFIERQNEVISGQLNEIKARGWNLV